MNLMDQTLAAEQIAGIYEDLEAQLMANIIRHVRDYDKPIDSDEWLMIKLAEIGKLNKENLRIIARAYGMTPTAIERMLQETADKALSRIEPGFAQMARDGLVDRAVEAGKSKSVKQVLQNYMGQAKEVLNTCNTQMFFAAQESFKKLVNGTVSLAKELSEKQDYLDILNKNTAARVTGAISRQQALRKTVKDFNARGIPAFVDRAGREWTPEAYVGMTMRTTASNTAAEAQFARASDHGINLIEITSHSGARPKCAKDQGQIFDRSNRSSKYRHWNTSSYGQPDGILGINCGHNAHPYIEGVSIQRYFPINEKENDELYKQFQTQRGLEREVRKQKRECMLYDELGDKESFEKASVRLKEKEAQLSSHITQNEELHRRRDREQVVGFDKRVSAEAVSANKKHQKALAQKKKDDIIKAEMRQAGFRGNIDLHPQIPSVKELKFDDAHINEQRQHGVTESEAKEFIQKAKFSVSRWNGQFTNFYSAHGAAYVDNEAQTIRTAFRNDQYDETVRKAMEIYEKGTG